MRIFKLVSQQKVKSLHCQTNYYVGGVTLDRKVVEMHRGLKFLTEGWQLVVGSEGSSSRGPKCIRL